MSDLDLDDLRSELAEFAQPEKKCGYTAREERVIAGFEEIQRFVDEHGRPPRHGEDHDIFERLYAVRLDRLRTLEEYHPLLLPLDHQGLLGNAARNSGVSAEDMDTDELMSELGDLGNESGGITDLKHVRSTAEKRAAEEIANREPCEDFASFAPLFDQVKRELDQGLRETRAFVKDAGFVKADITQGQFFILGGQMAYVADVGEMFRTDYGQNDARLRVIFSNGTESNLLLRSLQRALYKDDAGRRITEIDAGPLFAGESDKEDIASGTIYVLRSLSNHPVVAANRTILHKIGVTGGDVTKRIAAAKLDATYLLADVEIVATYTLYNINRAKLEALIHRIFDPARLDITIEDRFGHPVVPREWFLVPLFVIDEAVEKIKDGSIAGAVYDPTHARLMKG